jgi:hypothetical protein
VVFRLRFGWDKTQILQNLDSFGNYLQCVCVCVCVCLVCVLSVCVCVCACVCVCVCVCECVCRRELESRRLNLDSLLESISRSIDAPEIGRFWSCEHIKDDLSYSDSQKVHHLQ